MAVPARDGDGRGSGVACSDGKGGGLETADILPLRREEWADDRDASELVDRGEE